MDTKSTVRVHLLEKLPIIKMAWDHQVTSQDVHHAFQQINLLLNEGRAGWFVMVDIRANPVFPITATLDGALRGPYRNAHLKEWLIIGVNPVAEMLEKIMASTTGRRNVRWFEHEQAAIGYVVEHHPESITAL